MAVLEEPFKTFVQTMLLMCAYAATGDVLIIQELLHLGKIIECPIDICTDPRFSVGEKVDIPTKSKGKDKNKDKVSKKDGFTKIKMPKKAEWDYSIGQAAAALGVSVVSFGEDIGSCIRNI